MLDLMFNGDVAIVTGAGRGIGREDALELARRGARVVVNDLASPEDDPAQTVVDEIVAGGGEAVASHDSVATPEGGAAMVRRAIDAWGRVDIVVNNAGVLRDKAIQNVDPASTELVLAVNLLGSFNVTVAAWPHFREQQHGRVVNTTSGSGLFGNFGQSTYGAAKAGVLGLTRVLAIEGRKAGIRVNAVAPAAATRMNADLLGERGALIEPRYIAPVVAYLAHRECELNGQVLSAGGGHVAAVLITLTSGITDSALAAEDIRDRLPEILSAEGASVPRHVGDELSRIFDAIETARA